MEEEEKDDFQRWTIKRKVALGPIVIRGETSIEEVAGKHGPSAAELKPWKERLFLRVENVLRARPKDYEALRDGQIKKLKQKIGDLVMDIDIRREAANRRPPMPGTPEGRNRRFPAIRCAPSAGF